jgi:hypothetical protein
MTKVTSSDTLQADGCEYSVHLDDYITDNVASTVSRSAYEKESAYLTCLLCSASLLHRPRETSMKFFQ